MDFLKLLPLVDPLEMCSMFNEEQNLMLEKLILEKFIHSFFNDNVDTCPCGCGDDCFEGKYKTSSICFASITPVSHEDFNFFVKNFILVFKKYKNHELKHIEEFSFSFNNNDGARFATLSYRLRKIFSSHPDIAFFTECLRGKQISKSKVEEILRKQHGYKSSSHMSYTSFLSHQSNSEKIDKKPPLLRDAKYEEKKVCIGNKKVPGSSLWMCGQCGVLDAKLMCGGCKSQAYCNEACSIEHWKIHKIPCKAARKVVATQLKLK